jgi:hypothetical protein
MNRIWKYLLIAIFFCCITNNSNAQSTDTTLKKEQFRDFKTEHLWDARVKISKVNVVGESKRGFRQVIPITGGDFSGARIKGEVLPGGEDWQLVRADGDVELNARYLLKTNDGVVIQVINQALIHNYPKEDKKPAYIRSVIDLEAPNNSPYDYLNHAIFIGTLEMPKMKAGEEPYVIIGVYMVL